MERVCTKYALNRCILQRFQKRVLRLVFARHQFPRHKITDLRQDLTTAVDAQVAGAWSEMKTLLKGCRSCEFRRGSARGVCCYFNGVLREDYLQSLRVVLLASEQMFKLNLVTSVGFRQFAAVEPQLGARIEVHNHIWSLSSSLRLPPSKRQRNIWSN